MDTNNHSEDLKTIRKIMEESSRFLSLSGLSGVFAGIFALAGSAIAFLSFRNNELSGVSGLDLVLFFDALAVLVATLVTGVYLSYRKAARTGTRIWSVTVRRMLLNLLIPLIAGAVFILFFYLHRDYNYIMPSMLIFYGLSLVSAGKFTFGEIHYLGMLEVLTGLLALVFPSIALFLWAFGFGVLHILYGLIMHKKYG
ncbi:MAG: hypothetical protein V2I34_10375 [Bacteroidales bacterium]|jgi:hypothetical protein|nr:hypothetical protein [Bacteroidales bacterium]